MSKPSREPVWKGPEKDGVTFSLLSRFLVCRERFRLLVVEGLKPAEGFNHRIEYGQMWHVCEEALAKGPDPTNPRSARWPEALLAYARGLAKAYPTSQEAVDHWYNVCRVQFPLYVDYWRRHPDVLQRTPLLQEQTFDVPYQLPSGRAVRLRGKWDSVDLIGKGKDAGVYLQENKTKSDIHEESLKRQLTFDLQTMLYLVALNRWIELGETPLKEGVPLAPVKGVRYNVVRRPLGGGKGSIVRHKPTKSNPQGESKEAFYERLAGIIREDPGYYFMRWRVEVHKHDIAKFRRECLDPILEQLCDWWDWIQMARDDPFRIDEGTLEDRTPNHFRFPYGVFNPMTEGYASDLDEYLSSGSEVGLQRIDNLFPELT